VLYARAHPRAALDPETPPPLSLAPAPQPWPAEDEDDLQERRLRRFVVPAALFTAWLLVQSSVGQFLVRTFLSMWVHELGHAVTAWLCGYSAFPGPWRTSIADERSPVVVALFLIGAGWMVQQGWRARNRKWLAAGGALALAQIVCSLVLRPSIAQALITFGGDAGCLVLGTTLLCTFYVGEESPLRTRGLRWGFVAIGAAAFVDAFHTWWGARSDTDLIPYGQIEGLGLSDPAKLVETHGWTLGQLVGRYVALGFCALAVLAIVYGVALWRARTTEASA
jgi:hypothetical protein